MAYFGRISQEQLTKVFKGTDLTVLFDVRLGKVRRIGGPAYRHHEIGVWELVNDITPEELRDLLPSSAEVEELFMAGAGTGTTQVTNTPTFGALQINISPANTAQQLPSLVIPDGFSVIIKSAQSNNDNVFVSDTAVKVAAAATRYQLRKGDFVDLKVTNLNTVWVLATQNNQKIEVIVEQ